MHNGVLLKTAEAAGFQVLLTNDLNMEYQQNLKGRALAVITISSDDMQQIATNIQKIVEAIDAAQPGTFSFVDIGH